MPNGKRCVIHKDAPLVLKCLDPTNHRWAMRVNAIGADYWRVVGEAHNLIADAKRVGQQW